jgi:hypothetical protein
MAYRRLPNSTPQRLRALMAIYNRAAATPPAQLPFKQETIDRLNVFYPAYHQKITDMAKALSAQAGITAQVITAKQAATWLVLDFIDALQNAIRRGAFDASVRALYDLPMEKRQRPKLQSEQDIITWGENIHDGETKRISLGGAPITFPSLAEVDAATQDFKTKNLQQSEKKYAYDNAQEAVQTENQKADKLILKCWNEIESEYDVGDKPSLRRKAREWGVVYVPRKGEKVDPKEYSIKGKITDQATGKPIQDAELKVLQTGETVLSEKNGTYLLPHLPPGNYTIVISKEGLQTRAIPNVQVSEGKVTTLNPELA